ncbi:MAG: sigma-E factor negative regulatory protein [Gammaproteobacteria bacterium]|nr:sigma-E factor negative regulatory protein [Gammaproteobacteria bacterium]
MQGTNDHLDSQLSALIDGELEEFETVALLKKLEHIPDTERDVLMSKWSRYQVAREALADECGHAAAPGFAALVTQRLAAEALPAAAVHRGEFRAPMWSRVAVAASVAFAVVIGVQQYQGANTATEPSRVAAVEVLSTPGGGNFGAVANTAGVVLPSQSASGVAAVSPAPNSKIAEERLRRYLLQHASNAAAQRGHGIAPFARVANFESE